MSNNAKQYADIIKQAATTIASASKIVDEVNTSQTAVKNQPLLAAVTNKLNNARLQDALINIDQSINKLKNLPPVAFGSENNKNTQLNSLQSRRETLSKLIVLTKSTPAVLVNQPVPTSSTTDNAADFSQATVIKPSSTEKTASAVNICTLPKPVDPQPSVCVFPEIAVCLAPEEEFWADQGPTKNGQGTWVPTGKIDGIGTWTIAKGLAGYPPGAAVVVYGQDGKTYRSAFDVPEGIQWSYNQWTFVPNNVPDILPPDVQIIVNPQQQQAELEYYKQQLDSQTKQLQRLNRSFNRPVEGVDAKERYSTDSWQYNLWKKGYSIQEINYGEQQAAKTRLDRRTLGNTDLFNARVEDIIQDGIIAGNIDSGMQEIMPTPIIGFDPISNLPTIPPTIDPVFDVDDMKRTDDLIICPPPLPRCGLSPVYIDPKTKKPVDPKKLPPALRGDRNFISQKDSRAIDLADLPGVTTCATNVVPTKNNWEDAAIGAGATVAELDTLRRTMTQTKLTPNANMATVAVDMLSKVRQQVSIATRGGTPGKGTNQTLYGGNSVNDIPGVVRCGVSPVNTVKANNLAQKKTTQAVDTRSTRKK